MANLTPCDTYPGYPDIPDTGLYLHIPFCAKKCRYCDFFSLAAPGRIPSFVKALLREIHLAGPLVPGMVDTVYIGGGTPSLLSAAQVDAVLSAVRDSFRLSPNAEVTMEVNPDSADPVWLAAVRQAGVNRINIGIQSLDDARLAFLGRVHSARQAEAALEAARRCGFDNIGADIIYALPGQTRRDLEEDLDRALSFSPGHISCYMLTCEPGTPMARALENREFDSLPDRQAADLFDTVSRYLTGRGYLHYEISNFATSPATMARHNTKYWRRVPYVGLGPSAHSYTGTHRWWNHCDLDAYEKALQQGRLPRQEEETLTPAQQMLEAIYLGLRTADGILMAAFEAEFGVDFCDAFSLPLAQCRDQGLVVLSHGRCMPTRRGMRFHETVTSRFAECL
ncbi:MAG: radical SAM family heme chaperone HemW [Thermodesulfobacteriota bacterium]|nr:radical SAM family heme chaperone HemW [Thermodesulfobacteriota bacterium]